MKGLKLMYEHKFKPVGIVISAAGLLGMITERMRPVIINAKWDAAQHYGLFMWLMLGGLFYIGYCKEKYDDERAQQIRLKSFQISFILMVSTMLAIGFVKEVARPADLMIDGMMLFFLAGLGIISYLLTFYTGLYFDRFWDFDDKDKTVWQNLKEMPKNIGGILVYLLVFTITLLLLMFMCA
jgi:hypothetical protein